VQTKICCKLVYKRAKIYEEEINYLVIDGSCFLCNNKLNGHIEKKPHQNSREIINFTHTGDFDACVGGAKRKLTGTALSQLIDMNKSPSFIRRNIARHLMEFGDIEPSHLPTSNALRVLKCKPVKKNNDPILSLSILKNNISYSTIIRDIGYDRFFVHYWSTLQINAYRQYVKQSSTPLITIDASGGVVRRPLLISGRKSKTIFLYEIAIHNGKSQFPIAHMLSERHNNNSIAHWLMEWIRDGAPLPKIVVIDQSIALMSACVRSFTQYSNLAMYLQVCSSLILNPSKFSLPKYFIRNDIPHVMKLISNWKEVKRLTYRIKNFYMRAFGLVITSTSFEDAKYLLKQIFIVTLNETDGINIITGMPTTCDIAKTYIKNRISNDEYKLLDEFIIEGNDVQFNDLPINYDYEEFQENVNSCYSSQLYNEICKIYEECRMIGRSNEGTTIKNRRLCANSYKIS